MSTCQHPLFNTFSLPKCFISADQSRFYLPSRMPTPGRFCDGSPPAQVHVQSCCRWMAHAGRVLVFIRQFHTFIHFNVLSLRYYCPTLRICCQHLFTQEGKETRHRDLQLHEEINTIGNLQIGEVNRTERVIPFILYLSYRRKCRFMALLIMQKIYWCSFKSCCFGIRM